MSDYKARIKKAIETYTEKQLKPAFESFEPRRKNKKPEEEVVKACLQWMRSEGFDVGLVEAKSVYSPELGRYLRSQVKAGTSDCFGNSNFGHAVFVEFKAPSKRGTLKPHQREFLLKKINTFCFAVCVDSDHILKEFYTTWLLHRKTSPMLARDYLISCLPKQKVEVDDDKLFDD